MTSLKSIVCTNNSALSIKVNYSELIKCTTETWKYNEQFLLPFTQAVLFTNGTNHLMQVNPSGEQSFFACEILRSLGTRLLIEMEVRRVLEVNSIKNVL